METDMYQTKIAYQVICRMLDSDKTRPGEKSALNIVKNKLTNIIARYTCDED